MRMLYLLSDIRCFMIKQLIFSIKFGCPITLSNCVTTICASCMVPQIASHRSPICLWWKCKLESRHLRSAPEGNKEREGRERFVHQRFFRFLGTRSASSETKKEEGIWFHLTLLPFQRCCSGSLVRAGGWGSVWHKPPLYLKQPPSPLPTSLQEHYQHTGRHKWVRRNAFVRFLFRVRPKIACSAFAHLDGLE